MSYDDYAKRHEARQKEFVSATFQAISDYERVIADPNTSAADRERARNALAAATRSMGVEPLEQDIPYDLNRDPNAITMVSGVAMTLPTPVATGGQASGPIGDVASHTHNVGVRSLGDITADVLNKAFDEQNSPSLSEKSLEQAVMDIEKMTRERGLKIAIKPKLYFNHRGFPIDGKELKC